VGRREVAAFNGEVSQKSFLKRWPDKLLRLCWAQCYDFKNISLFLDKTLLKDMFFLEKLHFSKKFAENWDHNIEPVSRLE
jgi:hypothetical protein